MPLEIPWHLIERTRGFSRAELREAGTIGTSLVQKGIFQSSGVNTKVICPECGGRCSDATWFPDEQRWRVYCGEVGAWNDVCANELEHFNTCIKTLLKCMAVAIGVRRDANAELIPEKLYGIGRFSGENFPPLFFVRGGLNMASLDLVIARLIPFKSSVVLCLGEVSALTGKISGISFLNAANVFSLDEKNDFIWDKNLVTNALNSKGRSAAPKPKRDWKPIVQELHNERKTAKVSLDEVTKEADALAEILNQKAEQIGCRAVSGSSIYNELFRGK